MWLGMLEYFSVSARLVLKIASFYKLVYKNSSLELKDFLITIHAAMVKLK
jgi:hypothetical protein